MTKQIGDAIVEILKPKGVMIIVEGKHDCVSSRETKQKDLVFITTFRDGLFEDNQHLESRFLKYIGVDLQ